MIADAIDGVGENKTVALDQVMEDIYHQKMDREADAGTTRISRLRPEPMAGPRAKPRRARRKSNSYQLDYGRRLQVDEALR